jgi:hypothetical protein
MTERMSWCLLAVLEETNASELLQTASQLPLDLGNTRDLLVTLWISARPVFS